MNRSAEQMAVATIVQCEASRANSILFSCINNDPGQYDIQYTRSVYKLYNTHVVFFQKELNHLITLISIIVLPIPDWLTSSKK